MIRPAIETALAALFISGTVYLQVFGHLMLPISPATADYLSLGAGLLGGWFVAGVWGAYPTWRPVLIALTATLLAGIGVLFLMVFGTPIIR